MKMFTPVLALFLLSASLRAEAEPNRLDAGEVKAGWKLLFDGSSLAGWHGIGKPAADTTGWAAENGWIHHGAGEKGADLITAELFGNFVVDFEWRISPGGNSGVKYFIDEKRGPVGHEYQILDDNLHPDGKLGANRRTAALYDALPAQIPPGLLLPPGSTNRSAIRVENGRVEHWLNGRRVLAYQLGSAELAAAKAASKFKNEAKWGTQFPTPILLQNHGDEVWFRSVKIQVLP